MPCDNKQPVRYLLTLNKHDAVKQLRSQLIAALDESDSCDLIIAEVFDNHIARVLVGSFDFFLYSPLPNERRCLPPILNIITNISILCTRSYCNLYFQVFWG